MTCEHRRRRRKTPAHHLTRAGRPVRSGSFAHRCGVSRCGHIFVPVRLTQETRDE
ncbi:hypothetical protein ACIBG8_26935 [Nonomuraea sp. NPDC050556]|uniref:hypothetical protein n=1 Tax=Nonomuraea sp. NPDC050556 TaxID=3364369 RepID=UPI0037997C2C